ncbi:MAG TPA: arsenite methyltransferase [Lacunisphaera sp.]|nr:arsenite methyltransferase [Lacunisphaera sp.]
MKDPVPNTESIREYVRERYGAIAVEADGGESAGCCGGAPKSDATACCVADEASKAAGQAGCGCGPAETPAGCCASPETYSAQLGYSAADLASVPAGADLGLGCGNPLAIASIKPGETVLDLGSGAGFDALLAARQLAGTGRVIGVDMTAAMISKARRNAARSGHANVEFRLGEIEALPVADACVDLIISNCVVNLSPEKPRVFAEAFRVLKSGGRLAISDVVAVKPLPADIRAQLPLIGACIGGASLVDELRAMLNAAGFQRVDVGLKGASRKFIAQWGRDPRVADYIVSAIITAWKP